MVAPWIIAVSIIAGLLILGLLLLALLKIILMILVREALGCHDNPVVSTQCILANLVCLSLSLSAGLSWSEEVYARGPGSEIQKGEWMEIATDTRLYCLENGSAIAVGLPTPNLTFLLSPPRLLPQQENPLWQDPVKEYKNPVYGQWWQPRTKLLPDPLFFSFSLIISVTPHTFPKDVSY